ncbi:MAG TPA: phospholipase D family protein [Steroidobacteraceae bacterium]|nr:phospholipase D family protein [Steroidobacteraceae bacterium]
MRTFLRLAAGMAVSLLAACASLEPRPASPHDAALPAGTGTALDDLIGGAEARHPGRSGFRLVREGPEAFAIRARSAVLAGRSIDVQTYIWHADLTGSFLAVRLLEAADRGVRVRLLVDDMDARDRNYGFAALDAHPNIDVRMFNPFASRQGTLSFLLEALGSFDRINRRMHNKTWIVDNRLAVVGGRNLGDEYFGASDAVNFVDLDFALVGPIVRDASDSFDRYWNSPLAYPMAALSPEAVTAEALGTLRERASGLAARAESSRFASELRANDAVQRLVAGDWPMHWASSYRFVADDPAKVLGEGGGINGSQVLATLGPAIEAARANVTMISPYFVPGPRGTEFLVGVDRAGAAVRVLTNSLAANDVALVYGGYSEAREDLLAGGVELWELKPTAGIQVKSSLFGSSGASLHTKALALDGRIAFVGSYNLDPRSTSLNCEQGIFVDNPEVAVQLEQIFRADSAGDRAWAVTLQRGELQWSDGTKAWDTSPEAAAGRRFQAWLAKVLPIDSQL